MTAPQGWGAPQQQFAPQQQHQQQPATPVADPFVSIPVTSGGAATPGARHLEGRTVIIRPIRVDENAAGFNKGEIKPTVIADIIVVDGGDLVYGDQVNNSGQQLSPPKFRVQTPAMFRGWLDSHPFIVDPLRDMIRAGQPVTVGIIERGTQGNRPWFLCETHTDVNRKPRTDPQYAQRRQNAIDLFNAFQTGQWQPPQPVELNPMPVVATQPQAWGGPQATTPAQQFAAPQGWPQLAATAQQQPATAVTQGWVAQQPAAAAPAAPMMPDLSRPVPGYESVWAQATEDQRRQAWQHHLQQSGGQPPAAPSAPAAAQGWGQPAAAPAATPWG